MTRPAHGFITRSGKFFEFEVDANLEEAEDELIESIRGVLTNNPHMHIWTLDSFVHVPDRAFEFFNAIGDSLIAYAKARGEYNAFHTPPEDEPEDVPTTQADFDPPQPDPP